MFQYDNKFMTHYSRIRMDTSYAGKGRIIPSEGQRPDKDEKEIYT
jgi:hypothetical protein